jgi:hypothetical protein
LSSAASEGISLCVISMGLVLFSTVKPENIKLAFADDPLSRQERGYGV